MPFWLFLDATEGANLLLLAKLCILLLPSAPNLATLNIYVGYLFILPGIMVVVRLGAFSIMELPVLLLLLYFEVALALLRS